MLLTMVLPNAIEYVFGSVNGITTKWEQDASGAWQTTVDQSADDLYKVDVELIDAAGNRSRYTETIAYELPRFVIDRTQQDIDLNTSKAYLNAEDLLRIEKNIDLIAGYIAIPVSVYTGWNTGDLPRISDYKRIHDNVEKIRSGYVIRADTPQTPAQPLNTYQKWNDLEKILQDVFWIYFNNLNNIDYCGEIYAGEGVGEL